MPERDPNRSAARSHVYCESECWPASEIEGEMTAEAEMRIVHWIDSSLQNLQVDKDDFPKPVLISSVGFVVDDTSQYITLARDDIEHDGDFRGLVAIPKIAIRTMAVCTVHHQICVEDLRGL